MPHDRSRRTGRVARFTRVRGGLTGGTYRCHACGKLTRETGEGESGLELCLTCFTEGGLENEHSDGGHEDQFFEECPTCREEKARRDSAAEQQPDGSVKGSTDE